MKISLITKTNTWHDKQLSVQAKKLGVELEKLDFNSGFGEIDINNFGDIIFWRSSHLDINSERSSFLNIISRSNKKIINSGLIRFPFIAYKFFQQKYAEGFIKDIETIPTFKFQNKKELKRSIEMKQLNIPFIKKPNLGARGEGVVLIKNLEMVDKLNDKDITKSIFQNFIENDGDYRVLVLGGRPLGVMRRIAREGGFLNNISKGGIAKNVEDGDLKERLLKIAAQIAALFELGFCGVDIIFDKKNGRCYFLELNTVPQWQGFQTATNINVANEIIKHCLSLNKEAFAKDRIALAYDQEGISQIKEKQFHFLSRMYLWTRQEGYLKKIKKLEKFFIGQDAIEWKTKINEIINKKEFFIKKVCNGKKIREDIISEYQMLGAYHEILFRNLIGEAIFGRDLKKTISEVIKNDNFIKLRDQLLKNKEHVMRLSTFAVNYFYFLKDYFNEDDACLNELIIDISNNFIFEDEKETDVIKNNIYFMTHCIIGSSCFYQKRIIKNKPLYLDLLRKLERMIESNYFKITLDNKLEFLVCCSLLDYKSGIRQIIEGEVANSFSSIGNFVVDKFRKGEYQDYFSSEHRNVLYLMTKAIKA